MSTEQKSELNDKMVLTDQAVDVINYFTSEFLKFKNTDRQWKRAKTVFLYFLIVLVSIISAFEVYSNNNANQIVTVHINGVIGDGAASPDVLIPLLTKAYEAKNAIAVIIQIDSPGGSPADANRIATSIDQLKKTNGKTTIAVINSIGASAAYMIAIHADKVIAGQYSLVGSIGTIIKTWDYHEVMDKIGVRQNVFASGKFKSMLNPYAEMTPDAKQKAQEIVDRMAEVFIKEVKALRSSKLKEGEWFSGEVWPGDEALKIGLIDEVGTYEVFVKSNYPNIKVIDLKPSKAKAWFDIDSLTADFFLKLFSNVT